MKTNWSENNCSYCVYSMFDMDHITTIPSIYICYNRKSEHYEDLMAWCSICSEFLSEDQQKEIIRSEWCKALKSISEHYKHEDEK